MSRKLIAGIGIAVFLGLVFFALNDEGCATEKIAFTERGSSLSGVIEDGEEVMLIRGYYDCRRVRRGDVVAYQFGETPHPLAKIVKAVPGDRFGLREVDGMWEILINGRSLMTSDGTPYRLTGERAKMLALYIKDYNGRIPPSGVLLLGNVASGSFDSTQFGLVDVRELLGKVQH